MEIFAPSSIVHIGYTLLVLGAFGAVAAIARRDLRKFELRRASRVNLSADIVLSREDESFKLTNAQFIASNDRAREYSVRLIRGNVLSAEQCQWAIKEIHKTIAHPPNFIIGLNPGGFIVALALGRMLKLEFSRIKYQRYYRAENAVNLNFVNGSVLVVEDIVRTGSTLKGIARLLAEHLARQNVGMTMMQLVALVINLKNGRRTLNQCSIPIETTMPYMRLPWTRLVESYYDENNVQRKNVTQKFVDEMIRTEMSAYKLVDYFLYRKSGPKFDDIREWDDRDLKFLAESGSSAEEIPDTPVVQNKGARGSHYMLIKPEDYPQNFHKI